MNNVNTRWVLYRGTLWDTKYIVGIFKSKESAMQTLNKFATPENYYIGVIDWEELRKRMDCFKNFIVITSPIPRIEFDELPNTGGKDIDVNIKEPDGYYLWFMYLFDLYD